MNSNLKFMLSSAKQIFTTCIFAALFAVATLTSCGGGSSSTTSTENNLPSPVAGGIGDGVLVPGTPGESPTPPTELEQLPVVSVGPRQFADPNVLLNLRGTAVAAKGATIVKTLWTQVTGPQVLIPSPQQLDNVILLPDVNVATQLEFRLTAQDDKDRINSATISILIKPVPTFVKVIGGVFNRASGIAVFKLRLNAPGTTPISVSYKTQDGTAFDDVDYVGASGEVVFAAGETTKEIPVTLNYGRYSEGIAAVNDLVSFNMQAIAIDGTTTHANTGVVVIGNGEEKRMEQTIQFSNVPETIYLKDQYKSQLNPKGSGTGSIFYSSSDTSVATVNAQGVVTPVALGGVTINATKLGDDLYAPATASFSLAIVGRYAAPTVSINKTDGYSVAIGQATDLVGTATDQEDGTIPTANQIAANKASGKPITALSWNSNIDGFLGYGSTLKSTTLTMGDHIISYSVTDSDGNTSTAKVRVLVGNIAPQATATASSTYCPDPSPSSAEHCYYPSRVNDMSLSTLLGGTQSWVNNNLDTTKLPQWVELSWDSPATISSVDIYTTEGYIIRNYDIEYFNGESWIAVASAIDNNATYRTYPISKITTSRLRVLAKVGSLEQPQHARINEIVVFGTKSPSTTSSSSSSSSSAPTVQ